MAKGPPADEHPESRRAIGKRLRALRGALERTQDEMARGLGSPSGSPLWAGYETGGQRISLDYALVLCRRYGTTLDWIYRGQLHAGMPFDLAEKIRNWKPKPTQA